jgi:hypothetical protein
MQRTGSAVLVTRQWLHLAALLLIVLLADSYAMHRVYVARMGNALDFYPIWAGSRHVLLHRQNPYNQEVMRQNQQAIYGRPALPDENQHGYAYPAHTPFLLAPFLLLPFSYAAPLWIALQQILLVAAVVLAVRATGWRIEPWRLGLLCLVATLFRYSMIVLVLGQTAAWVFFALALALWAARRQRAVIAALSLAAGTLKPQLVLLPALALLTSLAPGLRRRATLAFAGALALLVGGSLLFAGLWFDDYWRLLQAYQGYSTTEFPLLALAGHWLPGAASQVLNAMGVAALLAVLGRTMWRWRGSGRPELPLALAVAITQLAVPQTGSYNLVLLLVPAVVALAHVQRRVYRGRYLATTSRVLIWATLGLVPWLLWPIVHDAQGPSLDIVLVPSLLLAPVSGIILSVQTKGQDEICTDSDSNQLAADTARVAAAADSRSSGPTSLSCCPDRTDPVRTG